MIGEISTQYPSLETIGSSGTSIVLTKFGVNADDYSKNADGIVGLRCERQLFKLGVYLVGTSALEIAIE